MYNTKLGSWGNLDGTVGMTYEDYNFLNKNVVGTKFSVMEMRENGMHMAGSREYQTPIQKDYSYPDTAPGHTSVYVHWY